MARTNENLGKSFRWSSTLGTILAIGAAVLSFGGFTACSSDSGSAIGGSSENPSGDDAGVQTCVEGSTKSCYVYYGEHNGILSCYEGTQVCENGVYGQCKDGTVVKRLTSPGSSSSGGMRVMSLSDAGDCQDNPCDPSCQVFDEEPDGGLAVDAEAEGPEWVTAPIKSLEDNNWPAGLFKKGFNEPCYSNMDCQFDQYCFHPVTEAACAHSKCATGVGLDATCDECVAAVCDVMPECCGGGGASAQCLAKGTACPGSTDCCYGLVCTDGTCQEPLIYGTGFSNTAELTGWSQTSGGQWSWGPAVTGWNDPGTDTTPTADDNVLGTNIGGPYWNNSYYWLLSPVIDTTVGDGALMMSVRTWEQFEKNWDYGYILASDDAYNFNYLYTTDDTASTWKSLAADVSIYRSTQFQLAFITDTDYSVQNGGWSIDDVKVWNECQPSGASCANGGSCCTDSQCVNGVCATPSTGPDGWSSGCVDKVAEVCGSFCPSSGACDHSLCLEGGPLASSCDGCVASICALDPACCTTGWDAHCVAKVGPVCNQNCSPMAGDCRQYSPGEVNPYCVGGPDLTAGVPCGNTIPICNRGDQTVLADTASFLFFPGVSVDANNYATCVVDHLPATVRQCPIPVDIPPGECRNIACGNLGNNGGILVNPPADQAVLDEFPNYAPIDECSCQNNWSLYKKSADETCGEPVCVSTSVEAKIPTVNMFIMFDRSGSMSGTRWTLTTGALRTFMKDPASAGLRVALGFFPTDDCGYYAGCTDVGCSVPQVPLGTLLAEQGPDTTCSSMPNKCSNADDPQECELIKAVRCEVPNGNHTPLLPALGGADLAMGNHAANFPMERSVVVLVTDGSPNWCGSTQSDFVAKAEYAYANWGVVTYTVNVNSGSATLMQAIANAGHGEYFFVSDSNAGTALVAALNDIRTSSVSCDLVLNSTMGIDPNEVAATFTASATGSVAEPLYRVDSASDCGTANDRFYYDDNTAPTKITLCPATCNRVRSDVGSSIDLEIGCPTHLEPETYNFQYSAVCPPGTKVQWGHLTWDATTPGNSDVTFEARTSDDLASFVNAPALGDLKLLGKAHDLISPYVVDTQLCLNSGPAPDCPVDLYAKLGVPDARYDHMELFVTLNPSSSGASASPVLNDWDITYSCPPAE